MRGVVPVSSLAWTPASPPSSSSTTVAVWYSEACTGEVVPGLATWSIGDPQARCRAVWPSVSLIVTSGWARACRRCGMVTWGVLGGNETPCSSAAASHRHRNSSPQRCARRSGGPWGTVAPGSLLYSNLLSILTNLETSSSVPFFLDLESRVASVELSSSITATCSTCTTRMDRWQCCCKHLQRSGEKRKTLNGPMKREPEAS